MKEGWTYKKLGEVCIKITDGSHNPPKGVEKSNNYMLSSQNVQNGYLDMTSVRYLSDENFKIENQRTQAKKGDVLLTIVGTIGRTCVLDGTEGNITFQRSVAILKPSEEINSRFLMFFLLSQNSNLNSTAQGAAQKGIYLKQLGNIELHYPPLTEQQQIVSRLDAAFADIDALKANTEKQLSEARALFQKALEEAMKPKKGWEEKTLGEVCEIFGRIGFRGYTKTDFVNSSEKGAITLSPSNIVNGEMNYSKCSYITWAKYEESPEIKIFPGDILLVKTASVGKTAIVKELPHEATINPQFVVLKNIIINRYYLSYYLKSEKSQQYIWSIAKGAAAQTVSQKNLAEMKVPFAPLSEQHQIVSHLVSLSAKVRELEEVQRKTLAECDALKQAMLREVFE